MGKDIMTDQFTKELYEIGKSLPVIVVRVVIWKGEKKNGR
jgi:hypothetical protein